MPCGAFEVRPVILWLAMFVRHGNVQFRGAKEISLASRGETEFSVSLVPFKIVGGVEDEILCLVKIICCFHMSCVIGI